MENNETSQNEPGGNTDTPGQVKLIYQLYRWFFTLKYLGEPNEPQDLWETLVPICKKFHFQLEEGANGYKHFQGCFSLKNKEYLGTVKNLIRYDIHLESCKSWFASVNYVTKDMTRIGGPWSHDTVWIKIPQKLLKWQEEVVESIKLPPDDRTICWYWSEQGNIGKTTLCKYLAVMHQATILTNASGKDIAYALPDHPKIVCFNLVRSQETYFNYTALEEVKDGLMFSSKYKSKTRIFNSPHVLVFANWQPCKEKLSSDRWVITDLKYKVCI